MRHLLRHARSHSSRNRAIAGWGPAARRTCNFARDASMCSSRSFSFLNVSRNPSDYVRHDTKLLHEHPQLLRQRSRSALGQAHQFLVRALLQLLLLGQLNTGVFTKRSRGVTRR
jgi:hypothetical protein